MTRRSNRHFNRPAPAAAVEQASAIDSVPSGEAPQPRITREPTLHELNRQSWAIDEEHARKRAKAEEAINAVAAPLLEGVQRGRMRARRFQKPLRPLVK